MRLILPFPPGGPTDIAGRAIAQKLSEQMQQPVIADNRPGAGNHLATELLRSMYGLTMVHVPYKGNVAGLLACATGEVDFGTFPWRPRSP